MRQQCAQKGISNTCRVGGIWRWCSVQARRIQTAATCTGEAGGSASHFSLFNLAMFNNCRGLLVPSQLLESSLKSWRTQKPKKNRLDLLSLSLDWSHLPSLIHNIWSSNYTFCQVAYRLSVHSILLANHFSMLFLHNDLQFQQVLFLCGGSVPFWCLLVSKLIAFHPHQEEEDGSLPFPTSSCTPHTHASCQNTSPSKRKQGGQILSSSHRKRKKGQPVSTVCSLVNTT